MIPLFFGRPAGRTRTATRGPAAGPALAVARGETRRCLRCRLFCRRRRLLFQSPTRTRAFERRVPRWTPASRPASRPRAVSREAAAFARRPPSRSRRSCGSVASGPRSRSNAFPPARVPSRSASPPRRRAAPPTAPTATRVVASSPEQAETRLRLPRLFPRARVSSRARRRKSPASRRRRRRRTRRLAMFATMTALVSRTESPPAW